MSFLAHARLRTGVAARKFGHCEEKSRAAARVCLGALPALKHVRDEGRATLYDVGKIIQALTMDTYQPLYLTDPSRFRRILSSFGSTRSMENQEDELQQMFEQPDQLQPVFHPIRELFILSILLNRKEMARLLWERIDEAIPAALTASKMLKAMASKEDDLDQKENMLQHADEIAIARQREHYTDTTDVDIRDSGRRLTWWQRIKFFYNAPIIKFRFNVLAYFAFLFLFSYIILTDFKEKKVSWKEWFLIVWVASLYTEEFRQIARGEINSWRHRILHWISDYWNMVDVAMLLLFGVGLGLRFSSLPIGTARIILALDLLIFYVRLLQSFTVSRNLGPKLIMIARMSDPHKIFTGVFYQAYFQMYGELFLEEMQAEGCIPNETGNGPDCPEYSWMGTLLLCGYLMLSNVLLLNLLIAMFSYTFSNVQENTDEVWKFQRYEVINEFFGRPPVPPPFIIISHCFLLFRFVLKKCCRCCSIRSSSGKLKQHLSPGEVKQFVFWEAINANNFITKQTQRSEENFEERMKITSER
ncbi:Transient receptor potential cation channel subfamily M member 3 [Holothuria leucospilota]|uniref:Transient receptor potential cation channel subfamily M member 3 n=1 Tax=Holothuria leucospilota TaxID=206669 RepID=A0A9Q1H805_HOLLE|nr:Transient receptor potential cation channel subfamily M member 3 [Holothuria leucospilota]